WERIRDGACRCAARVLRGDVRGGLAEAGGYAAVGRGQVEYGPTAMQHCLIRQPESGADPRLEIVQVAIERRTRRAVLADESDAPIDLGPGEPGLVDLARDRIDCGNKEVAIQRSEERRVGKECREWWSKEHG